MDQTLINKLINSRKENMGAASVVLMLMQIYTHCNNFSNKIYMNLSNNKNKKKGSNRMVKPNLLILSYDLYNKEKYLNVSVDPFDRARLAEWLMQLIDTQSSFTKGFVGSIPTPGAVHSELNDRINKIRSKNDK